MSEPWRPASGATRSNGDGTCRTLWRVCRDIPDVGRGSFEQLKCSNGRVWLHRDYDVAKRKADKLNAALSETAK